MVSAGSLRAPSPVAAARHDEGEEVYGLSPETWVKVAILAPLFVAVYWIVLRWLWDKTNPVWGEANWGHAVCIPFVGLYYLYINREDLLKQPVEPLLLGNFRDKWRMIPAAVMLAAGGGIASLSSSFGPDMGWMIRFAGMSLATYGLLVGLLDWGIGSLLMGLIAFAYGIWPGQNQFLQGCAMILTLFGIVLMLCGWRVMRYAWFPIVYLICAIPWPALVYSYIASPLQTFAAKVAVVTLRFTGVNAYRTGTKINMGGITEPLRTLNVAEACAGLRSLMTFITVGMAVAFLSARPLWQKIVITISSVPIAIFCNVMRVAGQGLLDHYVSRQLSESFAHQFVGLVMLVPAFFMILMVGWVLDQIFVEEADDALEGGAAAATAAQRQQASLVLEIPRKPMVQAVPGVGRGAPKAQSPAAPKQATPPRPGIVPPRPTKPQAGPQPPKPRPQEGQA
ncbi:MAG TPA: exosortase [Tepidisphaeraceae bacterium]|nr:exosortase [Tepidisphaeraceae bacterium]